MNARQALSDPRADTMRVRLLGPFAVERHGRALALPASRKVRALFGYLAVAARPVSRSQLCELLWDGPSDPRGELRWCLSKLRALVDDAERRRLQAQADTVRLDLTDCAVDAIDAVAPDAHRALRALVAGDFLEGMEMDATPMFELWLTAQRRIFRARHAALLQHLAANAPEEEASCHVERWLQLSPFDARAHEALLALLARRGRIREAEEHMAAAAKLFASEGLDITRLREAWRSFTAALRHA